MGIALADLSLREQIQLLSYLARVDYQTAEKGFTTIREHGLNAARAFLSCEYGTQYGDEILKIADQFDHDDAAAIFQKYCEIVDAVNEQTADLLETFFVADTKPIDRERLNQDLLLRAKNVIASYAGRSSRKNNSSNDIEEELEHVRRDLVLFAAVFKEVSKHSKLTIEEIKGLRLESKSPEQLTQDERENILGTFIRNWGSGSPQNYVTRKQDLETSLNGDRGGIQFFTLKKDGEIIASLRFEERRNEQGSYRYGDFFDTPKPLQESGLGAVMIQKVIEEVGKTQDVCAGSYPDSDVCSFFIEKLGFVGDGMKQKQHEKGQDPELWVNLKRTHGNNPTLRSREEHVTIDTVKKWTEGMSPSGIHVYTIDSQKPEWANAISALITKETQKHPPRVLARYLIETRSKNNKMRYLVFEEPSVESTLGVEVERKAA